MFSPDPLADVDAARVGYALAKCIAKKHVVGDPVLRRLDPLGNAAAIHTMALRMADELREEVEIVLGEVRLQLREAQGRALDAAMDEDGSAG